VCACVFGTLQVCSSASYASGRFFLQHSHIQTHTHTHTHTHLSCAVLVLNHISAPKKNRMRYQDSRRSSARGQARLAATVLLHALHDTDLQRPDFVLLLDNSGSGISNINPWTVKIVWSTVVPNLPVRASRVFIVNPPFFAAKVFYPILLSFMSAKVRQNHLVIQGAKKEVWASRLAYFDVPLSSVPTELGGSAHVDCDAYVASVCSLANIVQTRTILRAESDSSVVHTRTTLPAESSGSSELSESGPRTTHASAHQKPNTDSHDSDVSHTLGTPTNTEESKGSAGCPPGGGGGEEGIVGGVVEVCHTPTHTSSEKPESNRSAGPHI